MNQTSIFDVEKGYKFWSRGQTGDFLLSFVALSQILLSAIQGAMIAMRFSDETSSQVRISMSIITIIIAVPVLIKRKTILVIATYFAALAVYLFHVVCYPDTIVYWHSEAFKFTFPISIPSALCIIAIKDKNIFYYVLKILAYLTGALCLIYGIRVLMGAYVLGFSYNQGFGYMLLFPILVLYYQRKWYSLLISAILFLFLLLYGARGPVLSIAIFFVYVFISKKKYLLLVVTLVAITTIIPLLNSTLESQGLSSRTLELYLSGEIDAGNGRDAINDQIEKGIQENPYGWGLFGDRVITHGANNAHNFIREILAEFGLYLGAIVLLFFLYQIVKRFIKVKGEDRDLYFLFFCACFIPTLVSGSYLTNTNFSLFIGIMFFLPHFYNKRQMNKYKVIGNSKALVSNYRRLYE